MDFQFDTTADGCTLKLSSVIDEFTRGVFAVEVDRSIDADGVVDVLGHYPSPTVRGTRCASTTGPEFALESRGLVTRRCTRS